eukprot:TRINITY_DN20585_c0_g1_i2.p1 TRINITY_DN20585_c0_g1~~TRINITY_DN20585_c0_g1_i2.p1  ORF type:complete len:274 (+),score=36.21 TRINITY_DN20585_c0_g1_i2:67-822(+)
MSGKDVGSGPLLAFDFDHTVVHLNTDVEVQKLHPDGKIPETSEIHGLYSKVGWTKFMGEVFKLLHHHNVKKENILTLMESLEFTPGMVDLLRKSVEEHNAKIIIISDSNSVFINHILETHNLQHLVDVVYTNPATWKEDGVLEIKPYHHQTDCDLSTENLCKGLILEEYIKNQSAQFPFVVYVGDGGNDFCPALRLANDDLVCVREGYSLQKQIPKHKEERGLQIKSEILYWKSGDEILSRIQEKLKKENE